jgi:hypothetical protein
VWVIVGTTEEDTPTPTPNAFPVHLTINTIARFFMEQMYCYG